MAGGALTQRILTNLTNTGPGPWGQRRGKIAEQKGETVGLLWGARKRPQGGNIKPRGSRQGGGKSSKKKKYRPGCDRERKTEKHKATSENHWGEVVPSKRGGRKEKRAFQGEKGDKGNTVPRLTAQRIVFAQNLHK